MEGVMNKTIRNTTLALAMLLAAAAQAAETGTMRQKADLMAAPYRDARLAGSLSEKTGVTILERRGAWLRVSAGQASGWVRLHQVNIGQGPQAAKSGDSLKMLWNVKETGRSGAGGIVATTGIRGMSAEELKNAKPDPEGVKQLDQFQASDDAARKQSAGVLKEQNVPFLPTPEK
jgi:hypothetical protein